MKNISTLFFLLLILTSFEALADCPFVSSLTLDKGNESLLGCDAAKIALKADPKAEADYRRNLNKKLADLIATQTKQIMQELGASSDFYEQNSESFLMGSSSSVSKSCKFDFIKNLESNGCNPQSSPAEKEAEKEKLKMIADSLGEDDNYKPKSLMEGMLHVYGTNKYGHGFDREGNTNQCPLKGNANPLNSQITEVTARLVIEEFFKNDNAPNMSKIYEKYPQLSMIKEGEKFSPGFQEKFEKYIRSFDPTKDKAKTYFSKFFFNNENKEALSKGVSHRCEQVRSSLSSFVCHPLKQVAAIDPVTSKKLFNGYNPKKEFQDQKDDVRNNPDSYKTFAFLCEAKSSTSQVSSEFGSNSSPVADCLKLKTQDDTIDNWYRCFNEGVKKEGLIADKSIVENFCQRYSCKSPDVLNAKSCKTGGPLTSEDLQALNLKDDTILSEISYMQTLEKHSQIKSQYLATKNSSSQNTGNNSKESRLNLSDFDLNAFGSDAVMKFSGIPETKATVTIVQQEMKDKGIAPSTPEQIRQVINREAPTTFATQNVNPQNNYVQATPVNYAQNTSYSAVSENMHSPKQVKPREKVKTQTDFADNFKSQTDSNEAAEKARAALDEFAKSLATTKREALANSISDRNAMGSNYPQSTQYKNLAETDKQSLRNWENRLSDWQEQLRRREWEDSIRRSKASSSEENSEVVAKEKATNAATAAASANNALLNNHVATNLPDDFKLSKNKNSAGIKVGEDSTATLSAEALAKLQEEQLKKAGLDLKRSFTIKVFYKAKMYFLPVQVVPFGESGKNILFPIYDESNAELKELTQKSPVFEDYRRYEQAKAAQRT